MKEIYGPLHNKKSRRKNALLNQRIQQMKGLVSIEQGLPIELENNFLQSVLAYEKQFQKRKKIRVSEKLGKPLHFKQVNEIKDDDIEKEWLALYEYMCGYGIDLQVCSPNVGARELYRFATEELFKIEVDDISLPGMMTCFIYDEFYPDHKYENQQIAVENCIMYFLEKKEFYDFHFTNKLQFNQDTKLTKSGLLEVIRVFRSGFDRVTNIEVDVNVCDIGQSRCLVNGSYKAIFVHKGSNVARSGGWSVSFLFNRKLKRWLIYNIQLEGVWNDIFK